MRNVYVLRVRHRHYRRCSILLPGVGCAWWCLAKQLPEKGEGKQTNKQKKTVHRCLYLCFLLSSSICNVVYKNNGVSFKTELEYSR